MASALALQCSTNEALQRLNCDYNCDDHISVSPVFPQFKSTSFHVRLFLLPLDWIFVHDGASPNVKFAGIHLYTWMRRGTVRVKCLAQEHNTMSPARD